MPDKKGIKNMIKLNPPIESMIVRLIDGSIHRFQFTEGGDAIQLASRIEKAFQAHDLVLELSGRLLVIPKHSILSVELTPAPPKLPAFTVRNVKLIEG
jgi:hypothetical protein